MKLADKVISQPDNDPGSKNYQICTKTVMDTSDPDITFDEQGVCNHYYKYFNDVKRHVLTGEQGQEKLNTVVKAIKSHGAKGKYNCILGLSGGVDSTYLCLLAKQLGLQPLVVHFDNGWNSELAVHNIEQIVKRLDFDLYTYVVDWAEFRDLQRSYFKANVVDIEVLTDHGFMAVLYEQAKKHKIKYVLGGMNFVTESVMPKSWNFNKSDLHNILEIQNRFGSIPSKKIRSYPMLSPIRKRYYDRVLGLEFIKPLNWVKFDDEDVKAQITNDLGWRDYGGKHYESIFTRFYQGHILPNKFHIDKRRAHYSNLICSGQMTRETALQKLSEPGYDPEQCKIDCRFVLKKLGFTEEEFESYIQSPRIEHSEYGVGHMSIYDRVPLLKPLKPIVNLFFK